MSEDGASPQEAELDTKIKDDAPEPFTDGSGASYC
jgi:hypothetical protein